MELLATLEQIMPLIWWAFSLLAVVVVMLTAMLIRLQRRLKRFEKSHVSLQTLSTGKNLDDLLEECLRNLDDQRKHIQASEARLQKIEHKLRAAVDTAKLVRFNAFDDVGGELSFALALLNQQGDGVILSSIHSREESRVYAKPVVGGQSKYPLSKEEQEVLQQGLTGIKV